MHRVVAHKNKHTHTHARTHARTHTYTHTHTQTHTHMNTHAHARARTHSLKARRALRQAALGRSSSTIRSCSTRQVCCAPSSTRSSQPTLQRRTAPHEPGITTTPHNQELRLHHTTRNYDYTTQPGIMTTTRARAHAHSRRSVRCTTAAAPSTVAPRPESL